MQSGTSYHCKCHDVASITHSFFIKALADFIVLARAFLMLYTTHMNHINLWKRPPQNHLDVTGQYARDLKEYTVLRDRSTGQEREKYDYIIEVMQRTLTELIDRNKE